eukprot:scaffold112109_cov28-Tisochrysis_lutea.AAC.6
MQGYKPQDLEVLPLFALGWPTPSTPAIFRTARLLAARWNAMLEALSEGGPDRALPRLLVLFFFLIYASVGGGTVGELLAVGGESRPDECWRGGARLDRWR